MMVFTVTRLPGPAPDSFDALSTLWWGIQVSAVDAATTVPFDLSADTVKAALVAPGTKPASNAWQTAAWDTDPSLSPTFTVATLQVSNGSPGGVPLFAPGAYDVWLQVTHGSYVWAGKVDEIVVT